MTRCCVALLVICGSSATAFADGKLSGDVTDLNDQPVGGAQVTVNGDEGLVTLVRTDPNGHYTATVHTSGTYSVVFSLGKAQVLRRIEVPAGGTTSLNATLDIGGEIIEIHEKLRPLQDAKPKQNPLKIPPYSDKAILEDHWSKAWLLLDIDERGVVHRVKFLKRPGNDLDEIAVKYAFGLQFDPARNHRGVPVRTYIVWPLEWPSHEWLIERFEIATGLPKNLADADEVLPIGMEGPRWPRCAGTGPTQLNSVHPTLRDCSVPDLSRADASEPWIARDASIPAPPAKIAPTLDPVKFREEQAATTRRFRTSAIVAGAVSGGMLVGGIIAYTQWQKYSDRAATAARSMERQASEKTATHWEVGMTACLATAIGTGVISGYLWSRSSHSLVLQPSADGGYIGYAGAF